MPVCKTCLDSGHVPYYVTRGGNEYRYLARCMCERGLVAMPKDMKRLDDIFSPREVEEMFAGTKAELRTVTVADLDRAGIPTRFHGWTFETYPERTKHLSLARGWVAATAAERSDVVMYGATGAGKTGLAVAMLRGCIERGEAVKWVDAQWMLQELRGTFNEEHGPSETDLLRGLTKMPVLVVDDLTAVKESGYTNDIMRLLVDRRQQHHLPTIYTLNYVPETDDAEERETALAHHFGPYVFDRLRSHGVFWHVRMTSQRKTRTVVAGPWRDEKARPVEPVREKPTADPPPPEFPEKWREALARQAEKQTEMFSDDVTEGDE